MTERKQRLAPILASLGILTSCSTLVVILLLRLRWITFHDDSLGYYAVGFFLVWMFAAAVLGGLLSACALRLNRQSRLALAGLVCALAPLLFLLTRQLF